MVSCDSPQQKQPSVAGQEESDHPSGIWLQQHQQGQQTEQNQIHVVPRYNNPLASKCPLEDQIVQMASEGLLAGNHGEDYELEDLLEDLLHDHHHSDPLD